MTGDQDRDVAARLTELEATIRGLTQELVSADQRIRQLEAAVEDATTEPATKDSSQEAEAGTEAPPEQAANEAGKDLDDIIVA